MSGIGKSFALILILIAVMSGLSLIIVNSAFAQTPPTPVFSVSTVNRAYLVPATYSTNPYTGANVTKPGYTVNTFNITFTVQNEPSVTCYELEYKGQFSSQWSDSVWISPYNVTAFASSGSHTIITFWGNNATGFFGQSPANEISLYYGGNWGINVPLGSQMDFRLQAVSGETVSGETVTLLIGDAVLGNVSSWSAPVTVTIPETSVSPTTTPTVSELPTIIVILPLCLSVFFVALILRHRKTANLNNDLFSWGV